MIEDLKEAMRRAEQEMGLRRGLVETDEAFTPQPWIDFAHGIAEATQTKARPFIAEKFPTATFVRLTPGRASLTVLSDNGVLGEVGLADAIGLK